MLSIGLDISSTSTGVVVLNEQSLAPVFQGLWRPPSEFDYLDRGGWQAEKLVQLMDQFKFDRILIDGYSLGSTNAAEPLITVGTVLRYFLRQSGYEWNIAAPSQVKKYACAAVKQDIKLQVFKRWEFEHRSDDVVDAYVLAQIGLAMTLGDALLVPLIRPQLEVVEAITNPKPKKRKKKGEGN
jgi:crossover junction endodeoxyribonuclease RuvC